MPFDEAAFQTWYAQVAANRGLSTDPDDPEHHYDYRAYYQSLDDAGKAAAVAAPSGTHFPSAFKADDHPNRFVYDAPGHVGVLWDTKLDQAAEQASASTQTETQAIEELLGFSPEEYFLIVRLLDEEAIRKFWDDAYQHLRAFTDPQDTPKKKADFQKGLAYLNSLREQAENQRNLGVSNRFSGPAASVSDTATRLEDAIRNNTLVRVGVLSFDEKSIQPTDISIREIYDSEEVTTLRSETEVTRRKPRSMTQIALNFTFAGPDLINGQLRPLIAQLRAIPCLTIESAFLTNALINHYATPEIEAEIVDRVVSAGGADFTNQLDKLNQDALATFDSVRDLLQTDDLALEYLRQRVMRRRQELGDSTGAKEKVAGDLLPVPASTSGADRLLDFGVAIPAVVTGVSLTTDPNTPNTLHMSVQFLRYSPSVFGPRGLEFRDANGAPVLDIGQCPWIRKYFEWAYLNKSVNPDYFLEPYNPPLGDKPDFECAWDDILDRRPEYRRTFPSVDAPADFVIESVEAAINFAVAPIPIIGAKYPTVHVMGQSGVSSKIVLATTSPKVVRAFHLMKDHVDAIARNIGGLFRDEAIQIKNAVLNVLGANAFIITSVVTEPYPETSNGYRITLTLAQSRYSKESQFRFDLVQGGIPEKLLRDFWAYLYTQYQAYRKQSLNGTITDVKIDRAMTLLFGDLGPGLSGQDGVINSSTLIAGMSYLFHQGKADWFLDGGAKELANTLSKNPSRITSEFFLVNGSTAEALAVNPDRSFVMPRRLSSERWELLSLQKGARAEVARDSIQSAVVNALKTGREPPIGTRVLSFLVRSPWASFIEISRPLWDAMLEVIMRVEDPPRSPDKSRDLWLRKLVDASMIGLADLFTSGRIDLFGDFPGLETYLNSDDRRLTVDRNRKLFESNYPDLVLPTYEEMFKEADGTLRKITLRGGSSRDVWQVFAPTYSQLGAEPPYNTTSVSDLQTTLDTTPKKIQDTVEPGFFYWTGKIKAEMINAIKKTMETRGDGYSLAPGDNVDVSAMKNADAAAKRKKAVLQVSINTEDQAFSKLSQKAQEATLWQHLKLEARRNRLADKVVTNKADKQIYEIINSDGSLLGLIVPEKDAIRGSDFKIQLVRGKKLQVGNPFLRNGVFDRHSEDHNLALIQNSLIHLKDNMQSPVRHYPAFRVFFVEWDANAGREDPARGAMASKINLIDDLYTTNAILSIHVTANKSDAPVAVLQILNTSGEFDKDVFIEPEQARADGKQVDDEREDYLKRMKLQSGTGIVIKMGYTSNPNYLDTVFTGQITEIEPGPILTVTAQGYKTELFQQISLYHSNGNAPSALYKVLNEFPLPHLGRKFDTRDLSPEEQRKITGGTVDDNTPGLTQAFRNIFGGAVTTAARNVYFESNYDVHTTSGEILKDIGESLNLAADKYWLFDRVTQWDAVWNICRHYPGLIAEVRPFDTEGTLFMGYPEQPYQFRRPTPREAIEYEKVKRAIVPVKMQQIIDNLIDQFWSSDYGTDAERTKMALASVLGHLTQAGANTPFGLNSALETATRISIGPAFDKWYPAWSVIEQAPSQLVQSSSRWTAPIGKNLSNQVILQATGVQNFQPDWDQIRGFHTELPSLLVCYFFGLDYNNDLIRSSINSAISRDFRRMMGPLYQGFTGSFNGGWFSNNRVTPEIEYLWWIGEASGMFYSTTWKKEQYYTDAGNTLENYNKEEGNPIGVKWQELARKFANDPDLRKPRVKHADLGQTFGKIVYDNWHRFRLFVHYFALFIQNSDFSKPKRELIRDSIDAIARSKLPPGYKSFRDYHIVMANRDIIENKITATTREMANTIIVRAPNKNLKTEDVAEAEGGNEVRVISHDQGWAYFPDRFGVPFSPRIPSGQRKLYIAPEPNANMPWSQANCLVSNMAEALRPMYRGWIKIVGRHVQPWDIVTINDGYTQMFGPIEVDQVTHEFTRETGWITTIEPHAVVSCNSVASKYLTSFWQDLTMWFLDDGMDWLSYIAAAITIMGTGGAGTPAAAAMILARKFGTNVLKRGVMQAIRRAGMSTARLLVRQAARRANWLALAGAMGRAGVRVGMIQAAQGTIAPIASAIFNLNLKMETKSGYWPVDLQPLVYKGDPFTAGLEPTEDDVFSFGDQSQGLYKSIVKAGRDFFSAPEREPLPGEGTIPGGGVRPPGAGG